MTNETLLKFFAAPGVHHHATEIAAALHVITLLGGAEVVEQIYSCVVAGTPGFDIHVRTKASIRGDSPGAVVWFRVEAHSVEVVGINSLQKEG